VLAVNANTIDITFDQKVNQTTLGTLTNGTDIVITGLAANETLIRAEGTDGNKVRVFFDNTVPFVAGTVYTVTINAAKVVNLNGTAMAVADNNKQFAAIASANAAPSVVSATQTTATTITVKFSEIVKSAVAADFSVTGGSVTSLTGNNSDTLVLTLTAALTTSGIKTLGIVNASIMDEAGVGNVAINASAATFAYAETVAPLGSVTASTSATNDATNLVITYDSALYVGGVALANAANVAAQYTAAGGVSITSAVYSTTGNTVTFVLAGSVDTNTITVASTLKDSSGNSVDATTNVATYTAAGTEWNLN